MFLSYFPHPPSLADLEDTLNPCFATKSIMLTKLKSFVCLTKQKKLNPYFIPKKC